MIFKYKGCVNVPPLAFVDDVLAMAECGFKSRMVNYKITSKIKFKKPQFVSSKCHNLHIGDKNKQCCNLFVQNKKIIESVNYETYLGDIIANDGSNEENIKNRVNKGHGIINQTNSIMKEIGLGFHIGLLLRDTNLINGILFNSESWYGRKTNNIEKFESIDLKYLRIIFTASSKNNTGIFLHGNWRNFKKQKINVLV